MYPSYKALTVNQFIMLMRLGSWKIKKGISFCPRLPVTATRTLGGTRTLVWKALPYIIL